MRQTRRVELDPDFMFDVQIKRLHEYKRQLMNALSIYDLYCEYKAGNLPNFTPTAVFASNCPAKSAGTRAPGHHATFIYLSERSK